MSSIAWFLPITSYVRNKNQILFYISDKKFKSILFFRASLVIKIDNQEILRTRVCDVYEKLWFKCLIRSFWICVDTIIVRYYWILRFNYENWMQMQWIVHQARYLKHLWVLVCGFIHWKIGSLCQLQHGQIARVWGPIRKWISMRFLAPDIEREMLVHNCEWNIQ